MKYAAKLLRSPAFGRQQGCFVAEGAKLCIAAAEAGLPLRAVYATARALQRQPALAALGAPLTEISEPVAKKISDQQTPQGAFALCGLPCYDLQRVDPAGRYLALEGVQDPANVGAALRSAAAFGYDGALLGPGCAAPFGPKALRAGMGAAFVLPLWEVADLPALLLKLRGQGMAILAAALQGAQDLRSCRPRGGLVLVVGSEGQGLSQAVRSACSAAVKIPIGRVESLNAAVAAGVLMWELGGRGDG